MTDSRALPHSPLPLRIFAGMLVVLGLIPLANELSAGRAVPWWPAAVREWTTAGLGVVLVAILVALVLRERLDAITARAHRLLLATSPRAFALGVAALVLLLAAFLARYCFAGQGFTGDEMAQQWHARILLSGRLFLPAEAHREFFSTPTVIDADGAWYSQFPIGGPAFLAVGLALRAAWLVNPVLAALTAANVYRFASRAFDETTARASTLLFALSPFVLIMSASQMNHVATLALVSCALAELPVWVSTDDGRRLTRAALVIGMTLGIAGTVRPLDGVIAAAAIGVFQLTVLRRDLRRWRSLAIQCAAGALPLAVLLWANWRTTGSPLVFGYEQLNGLEHGLGFHADPTGLVHTPERGLIIASGYVMKLNRYLFEWPIPALVVIVAALVAAKRATRWELLLAGLTSAIVAVYGAYWFDGFFAGPRFLYLTVPALVIFTARMPAAVVARLPAGRAGAVARRAVVVLLPLCVAYAWMIPSGVSSVRMRVAYYRELRSKLKTDVGEQIARAQSERGAGLEHALVFVRESWHARLVARLRALDMTPLMAEQVLEHGDACVLQGALDAADTLHAVSIAQRRGRVLAVVRKGGWGKPVPGLPAENRISIVPGSRPTPACLREVAMDDAGTMPYALFLAQQEIGADGRPGGKIVFVRDMGPRNELLRQQFGDRTWYRYRAPRDLDDREPVFVRYETLGVARGQ